MLLMLRASNMNPKCDIVLYAYNLFILDWVNPSTVPIIRDNKLLTSKQVVQLKFSARNDLLV